MPPQNNSPLLALTTDFGDGAYVAMLKGTLLRHLPNARLVDVSHRRPETGIRETALLLRRVYSYYPAGTLHVVGVDPWTGAGSGRRRVLIARAGEQCFLAADNGVLGMVLEREQGALVYAAAIEAPTSFLARDVLAPLAARLAHGAAAAELGAAARDWAELKLPRPRREAEGWRGEVLVVDDFGNILTNFTREQAGEKKAVEIGGQRIERWAEDFAGLKAGELFLLWGAEGWLEIAVAGGSAAERLGVGAGTAVGLR